MNPTRTSIDNLRQEIFLEKLMQRVRSKSADAPDQNIPHVHQVGPVALSFAQQRLWFLCRLDARAGAAYHIPGGVRLSGALDTAALQAALDRIVARHAALRTRFLTVDGQPMQLVDAASGFALSHVDLRGDAQPEQAMARLSQEEASAPFDLEHGPLIRGRLLRLAEHEHVLLVTMHHIVSDGWSMSVLINEFSALYAAFAAGRPDPLPALRIQYADYSAWQRRWLDGALLQRQQAFWSEHLAAAPALLELPTDRPRPPVQDYAGASVSFTLDAELSAGLNSLSQRHGSTLFMTLLAAWAALLGRLSGQTDVVIGTPVANRTRSEVEPLIGFFVNTQALRVDLSGSPTVAELLAQVRRTALAAQTHQDLPFEQVVEALQPVRSMAHSPVFQTMLAWQNTPQGTLDLPGLQLQALTHDTVTTQFDLTLDMHQAGEQVAGSFRPMPRRCSMRPRSRAGLSSGRTCCAGWWRKTVVLLRNSRCCRSRSVGKCCTTSTTPPHRTRPSAASTSSSRPRCRPAPRPARWSSRTRSSATPSSTSRPIGSHTT